MNLSAQTKRPLVTVVIPCYNHERYIEACVDSVYQQDYDNQQVIVIDDGSGDSSPEILTALAEKYGFHLLIQKNKGLATTLNTAIGMAEGKYFCTMGSDDIMLPSKTTLQVSYMEKYSDVAVCGGNVEYIDGDGVRLPRHEKRLPERTLNFDELFTSEKLGIAAPTAMFRTDVLRDLNGFDTTSKLEDLPMWLRLTDKGYKIGAIGAFVLQYRKHSSNTYKNLDLMVDAITDAYFPYQQHPSYEMVMQKFTLSMFLKASKSDPELAWDLFKKIKLSYYNNKIPRAFVRLGSTLAKRNFRILIGNK